MKRMGSTKAKPFHFYRIYLTQALICGLSLVGLAELNGAVSSKTVIKGVKDGLGSADGQPALD